MCLHPVNVMCYLIYTTAMYTCACLVFLIIICDFLNFKSSQEILVIHKNKKSPKSLQSSIKMERKNQSPKFKQMRAYVYLFKPAWKNLLMSSLTVVLSTMCNLF